MSIPKHLYKHVYIYIYCNVYIYIYLTINDIYIYIMSVPKQDPSRTCAEWAERVTNQHCFMLVPSCHCRFERRFISSCFHCVLQCLYLGVKFFFRHCFGQPHTGIWSKTVFLHLFALYIFTIPKEYAKSDQ